MLQVTCLSVDSQRIDITKIQQSFDMKDSLLMTVSKDRTCLLVLVLTATILPQCLCREEDASDIHGHITSVAVARTHRKLGIATRLMQATRK